jgi:hypothetical protein
VARSGEKTIATTSVTNPVATIHGSTLPPCVIASRNVAKNPLPAGIGIPKKLGTCAAMISNPAPAVKPTITVCEMKLTSVPCAPSPSRAA